MKFVVVDGGKTGSPITGKLNSCPAACGRTSAAANMWLAASEFRIPKVYQRNFNTSVQYSARNLAAVNFVQIGTVAGSNVKSESETESKIEPELVLKLRTVSGLAVFWY
ncbi:hypothetical protein EVAR_80526_1 [Eumeta japonica]|uniref:Uncharacterized protein n=1 Tax=Eumeta variegata TaxID=151549 RepID=A0A4C1TNN1_EUMVA|nr:hypothetical protein EVAR_80526_1 [Eumeta japonica]